MKHLKCRAIRLPLCFDTIKERGLVSILHFAWWIEKGVEKENFDQRVQSSVVKNPAVES